MSNTVVGTMRLGLYFGHQVTDDDFSIGAASAVGTYYSRSFSSGGADANDNTKILVNVGGDGMNMTSFSGNAIGVTHDSVGGSWDWVFAGIGQN